jgi:hypothetical protein
LITLPPGESLEHSVFRFWDAPGVHQLTVAYFARSAGRPFARLAYPTVAIHVRAPEGGRLMYWVRGARAALVARIGEGAYSELLESH